MLTLNKASMIHLNSSYEIKTASDVGSAVKRLDIGGVTYIQTKPGTLVKASTQTKRIIARYHASNVCQPQF